MDAASQEILSLPVMAKLSWSVKSGQRLPGISLLSTNGEAVQVEDLPLNSKLISLHFADGEAVQVEDLPLNSDKLIETATSQKILSQ